MNKLVIAAVIFVWLAAAASGGASAAEMKFPNSYAYQVAYYMNGKPYLQCGFMADACLRGKSVASPDVATVAGEIVTNDLKTVLQHVVCIIFLPEKSSWICLDYDRGVIVNDQGVERPFGVGKDMPWSCVEAMRERQEACEQ